MIRQWILGASLLGLATGLAPPRVSAKTEEAVAEVLFQDAKVLIEQGKYVEACPKLRESHRIDPAGGTVLLLAICYEQIGMTASAWVKFNEALAMARRDARPDREQRARERLEALGPLLARLRLEPSPEGRTLGSLRVTLDGTPVPLESLSELPVDPGEHDIAVSAPGKRPWSVKLSMRPAEQRTLVLPALENEPSKPRALPAPVMHARHQSPAEAEDRPASLSRVAGWALGASGLVSLGVAGYYGWRAKKRHDDAVALCPTSECASMKGVELNEDAEWAAERANAFGALGLLAVGAGITLILTAGDSEPELTALVITPYPGGAAFGATRSF